MSEPTFELIFGIFSEEKLVLPIGAPTKCTLSQAEFVAHLFAPTIEKVLPEGHYFAYDFKKERRAHNDQ